MVSRHVNFLGDQKWNWYKPTYYTKAFQYASLNEDTKEPPVRGTWSLKEVYERSSTTICKPNRPEDTLADPHWKSAIHGEVNMIQKKEHGPCFLDPKQTSYWGVGGEMGLQDQTQCWLLCKQAKGQIGSERLLTGLCRWLHWSFFSCCKARYNHTSPNHLRSSSMEHLSTGCQICIPKWGIAWRIVCWITVWIQSKRRR